MSSNHSYYTSLNIYFISALHSSKSKIMHIISNQLNSKFFFKTSYLNKIIKSVNTELSKIQKILKSLKFILLLHSQLIKKIISKFHVIFQKNIKQHIKTYLSKILIRELKLKGIILI